MFRKLFTIVIIFLAAIILAGCGSANNIVASGGRGAGLDEPIDPVAEPGDTETQGETEDDGDDNSENSQSAGGKVFNLQEMMSDVHSWLPQIAVVDEDAGGDDSIVPNLFKPECHMYSRVNVCPEGAKVVFENKFTLQSIIGLIEHAGMYASNIFSAGDAQRRYTTCGVGNEHAELEDHTAVFEPTDSDRFVIDFHDLFDCAGSFMWEGKQSYILHSKSSEGDLYASLTSRKEHRGTEWYTGVMSDIFQSYLRTNLEGSLRMLAYNGASFDEKNTGDFGRRSMLIVNQQTMRLAVKIIDIGGNGIVLVGGMKADNSEAYYMAKAGTSAGGADYVCVKGKAGAAAFADESECGELDGAERFFENDNWPAGDLYTWLGLERKDKSNLSGFDSFFSNANFLSEDMVPQNGVDYFPDSISR